MSRLMVQSFKSQIRLLKTSKPLHAARASSTYSHLHEELTSRRLPLVYDNFSTTPSHLLNISLADHLPITLETNSRSSPIPPPSASRNPSTNPSPSLLPHAHHLIYFPAPIPGSLLLPDGTDPLQSPGPPFSRRMWAGGRIRFNNARAAHSLLALDARPAVCVEGIRDVTIKGLPGAERIFVGVERRVGRCATGESEESIRARLWPAEETEFPPDTAVIERRNIVFLRPRSDAELAALKAQLAASDKAAGAASTATPPAHAPQHAPEFSHTLHPDAFLLFRYSALMYNAHAIHLDPEYCREVEGHRGLLVHGPLSFTLLLTVLRLRLLELGGAPAGTYEAIREVEYRNLAPLYSGEPLRLCGRRVEEGKWEIWAETPEGGLALRGVVKTEHAELMEGAKGPGDMFEDLSMFLERGGDAAARTT